MSMIMSTTARRMTVASRKPRAHNGAIGLNMICAHDGFPVQDLWPVTLFATLIPRSSILFCGLSRLLVFCYSLSLAASQGE